jgi:hypothetical protein
LSPSLPKLPSSIKRINKLIAARKRGDKSADDKSSGDDVDASLHSKKSGMAVLREEDLEEKFVRGELAVHEHS